MTDSFREISKKEFIRRLMVAGWPKKEAFQEWKRIQEDQDG
jgi:hypothetical protein